MTALDAAESLALSVALAQIERGEDVGPNTAAVCIMALARITRGEQ